MRYEFDGFRLDTGQYRLELDGSEVHVEPLIFDLLVLFAANPGVVIDRDRMIAEVWKGRIVSDATIASAVKAARRALGDSGATQRYFQTVRGRGFRFAATVRHDAAPSVPAAPEDSPPSEQLPPPAAGPPAVAVLPFDRLGDAEAFSGLEEAVPHEIIVELSRLNWLFVIARGSSFTFRAGKSAVGDVGDALGVGYCVTGAIEVFGPRLTISVELADTRSSGVIWSDRFAGNLEDVHHIRAEIASGIAARLEHEIQRNEALLAQGRPTENLDAWQAFHLGLRHVHSYNRQGTAAAQALFQRAVQLDPTFARAHAGLSYAHFQNAFMRYLPDREAEIAASRASAETGLEFDPLDAFCNFTMGRSFWLTRELDSALPWLERAVSVSPSFAQGIYSRSLIDTLAGRATAGAEGTDLAMKLSPLDPLLHAMRGARALALMTAGDDVEAAKWGTAAARTPRAHAIIDLLAAAANELGGDAEMARHWAASAHRRNPGPTRGTFFDALPVQHGETRERIDRALARLGF